MAAYFIRYVYREKDKRYEYKRYEYFTILNLNSRDIEEKGAYYVKEMISKQTSYEKNVLDILVMNRL